VAVTDVAQNGDLFLDFKKKCFFGGGRRTKEKKGMCGMKGRKDRDEICSGISKGMGERYSPFATSFVGFALFGERI